jgi:hypothetical protein
MIIGITGLAGSGKTEVAKYLHQYGFRRTRFADPLKKMLRALGLSARHVDGDLKEKPCALLGGATPRWAMQTLGTEWGRRLIWGDIWIKAWERSAKKILKKGGSVVADDVRFPNEVETIRSLGGIIINIERPGHNVIAAPVRKWWQFWRAKPHESEAHRFAADFNLVNDGTMVDLFLKVDNAITDMVGRDARAKQEAETKQEPIIEVNPDAIAHQSRPRAKKARKAA